jgi:hypothetical protein
MNHQFATSNRDANESPCSDARCDAVANSGANTTRTPASVSSDAGSRRRSRRLQNRPSCTPPPLDSRSSNEVMRKPESVKKLDTPR